MNIIKNTIINNSYTEISMLINILMNLNTAEKLFKKMNIIQNKDFTSITENILQDENMNFDDNINIL